MKIFLVGDLILDEPNPNLLFDGVKEILKTADILVGHVEVPHTNRGKDSHFDIPAPPANPEHLEALKNAGFHGVTLAGNHFFDAGKGGVEDTISKLHSLGIKTTGAGMNLDEARKPAIFENTTERKMDEYPPILMAPVSSLIPPLNLDRT